MEDVVTATPLSTEIKLRQTFEKNGDTQWVVWEAEE
jgi:hypothetical protein